MASTTGGVPSLLGVCILGRMCTGGGIHYRGCTFITGGVYIHKKKITSQWTNSAGCLGVASTTGGVPSLLGVCHTTTGPSLHVCTGGGIHYRGCTFIAGGVHTRRMCTGVVPSL